MTLPGFSIENKSILIFGVSALILSLITGILAGIAFAVVLIRSLIITIVFAALGFGVVYIIKRFIPELYDVLKGSEEVNVDDIESMGEEEIDENSKQDEVISNLEIGDELPEEQAPQGDKEFTELKGVNFEHLESVGDLSDETTMDTSKGKLGKHVISSEKVAQYEPKLMAEAIRTMMGKDED
ncbi:hypothetical protein ACFL20_12155 [Spirochaetota bacterium]